MTDSVLRLSSDKKAVLRFLDQHRGEWYCSECLARAVGVPTDRIAEVARLAVQINSSKALAAGYVAKRDGPCFVCDAKDRKRYEKGEWSLGSQGKVVRL